MKYCSVFVYRTSGALYRPLFCVIPLDADFL